MYFEKEAEHFCVILLFNKTKILIYYKGTI